MNIELAAEWTYRTPLATITFPAGRHDVAQPIADAAWAAGALIEEKADGEGIAAVTAPRRSRKAQG